MKIYLVTCMKGFERKHTWAWYPSFLEAARSVFKNATGMFEDGYYEHAVIEEVSAGIVTVATVMQWYRVSYVAGKATVAMVHSPAFSEGFCNWGIG